jgi:ribosomal protein L15
MSRRDAQARLQESERGSTVVRRSTSRLLEKEFDRWRPSTWRAARRGLVPKAAEAIKILGEGELTKKLTVNAHKFSALAKDKVEKPARGRDPRRPGPAAA